MERGKEKCFRHKPRRGPRRGTHASHPGPRGNSLSVSGDRGVHGSTLPLPSPERSRLGCASRPGCAGSKLALCVHSLGKCIDSSPNAHFHIIVHVLVLNENNTVLRYRSQVF